MSYRDLDAPFINGVRQQCGGEGGSVIESIVTTYNLIKSGTFNTSETDNGGNSPLMKALLCQYFDVAMQLIKKGLSHPEHTNDVNLTALMLACAAAKTDIALVLIETNQSLPGHFDSDGRTALMYACENKMMVVALALIATGQSSPDVVALNGKTALWYAKNNKMDEVVRVLEQISKRHQRNPGNVSQIHVYFNARAIKLLPKMATIGLSNISFYTAIEDINGATQDIMSANFCEGIPSEYIIQSIKNSDAIVTIESSNELLGFTTLNIDVDASSLKLEILCTNPKVKNIGTYILNVVTAIATKLKLSTINLSSVDDAVGFYVKNGFTNTGNRYIGNNMVKHIPISNPSVDSPSIGGKKRTRTQRRKRHRNK